MKQQLIPYYGSGEVFGGGMKIYTSIDLELQQLAREAIDKWLTEPDGPTAALVAIDPRDGKVLAMVGGESFRKSQFNLAVQGQRQTGSSFKPFVLTSALEQGISPQTVFESEPTTINLGDKLWSVANYEGSYLGPIDLTEATIHSDNTVYAQLTAQVGPKNVAKTAHRLGVTRPLDDYFAIGLGVEAVSPLEMARAFATLASGGKRVDGSVLGNLPRAVLRVEHDRRADSNDPVAKQVVNANNAAIVNSILQGVVTEGTGERAALDDRPVAGKTGTTENYGDAWFVGYTPQLAVAVWVGYPDRLKPMETEYNGDPVAGGTFPALIWKTLRQERRSTTSRSRRRTSTRRSTTRLRRSTSSIATASGTSTTGTARTHGRSSTSSATGPTSRRRASRTRWTSPTSSGHRARSRRGAAPLHAADAGDHLAPGRARASGSASSRSRCRRRHALLLEQGADRPSVARATGASRTSSGLSLEQARNRLAKRRLAGTIRAYADGAPAGTVLAQFPRAGRAAVPNMTIRLIVARG